MSAIANLSSAAAALVPASLHPHGHKKGPHVQSAGGATSGTASVPTELKQNLFGSLLNSLEQAIGVQAPAPADASTGSTSASTGPVSSSTNFSTVMSAAGTDVSAAAQSSMTLLRNYLNNLLHNPRADGAAANPAGANLNVTA